MTQLCSLARPQLLELRPLLAISVPWLFHVYLMCSFFLQPPFSFNFLTPHLPVNSHSVIPPCILQRKWMHEVGSPSSPSLHPHLASLPTLFSFILLWNRCPFFQIDVPSPRDNLLLFFALFQRSQSICCALSCIFNFALFGDSLQSLLKPCPLTPYLPLATDLFSFSFPSQQILQK